RHRGRRRHRLGRLAWPGHARRGGSRRIRILLPPGLRVSRQSNQGTPRRGDRDYAIEESSKLITHFVAARSCVSCVSEVRTHSSNSFSARFTCSECRSRFLFTG